MEWSSVVPNPILLNDSNSYALATWQPSIADPGAGSSGSFMKSSIYNDESKADLYTEPSCFKNSTLGPT